MDQVLRVALALANPEKFLPEPSEAVDWRTDPRRPNLPGSEVRDESEPTGRGEVPAPETVMRPR
jgi:hypothetical protein